VLTMQTTAEPKQKPRTWGFRFFLSDALVIGILMVAAAVLRRMEHPLWWLLIIVAGHFFLFCNIFRVRRRFELVWAGLFLVNSTLWVWSGNLNWILVVGTQLPVTVCVIVMEIRSHRYHGIFAQYVNPRLDDYLEGKIP